jgi:RNA polymerase sigma-70 factor (ECF subfamily)
VSNKQKNNTVVETEDHCKDPSENGLSNEDLMSRYGKLGRDEDFSLLISRFEGEIYRYLVRYLGSRSLADDVFQDTFLQIHQKRHMYEQGRAVRPWIYSIANHQAIDTLRRVGRRSMQSLSASGTDSDGETMKNGLENLIESATEGPLARLQTEERQAWVRENIDSLPETLRETLILAYYQDLKYREIADVLHIPVGTVKSRLHSALAKLAERAKMDHIMSEDGE